MNTMAKMRRTNSIIKKELVKRGFFDIVMFPHTRHFKDVYNIFDGICKRPRKMSISGEVNKPIVYDIELPDEFNIHWLQFKTGHIDPKDTEKIIQFCGNARQHAVIGELLKKRVKKKSGKGNKTISYVKIRVIYPDKVIGVI